MKWHYPALLLLLIGAVAAGVILSQTPEPPEENGNDGNNGNGGSGNESQGKPIYYYFYSDSCPACTAMENEILSNRTVIAKLEADFQYEKVNTNRNPALARTYNIIYVPTSLFAYSDGTEIARRVGAPPDTEIFLATLQEILDFHRQAG